MVRGSVRGVAVAAVMAFAGVAGSVPPASAQEVAYEKIGRWAVVAISDGGRFQYCAADLYANNSQLRVAMDGRSWRVGVPYYGQKKKVDGYYGFGDAAEVGNFRVTAESWAFLDIDGDQVEAFRSAPSFDLDLGQGAQSFKLAGAAPAVDKARECAQNRGVGQAAVVQPGGPVGQPGGPVGRNCPPPGRYRSQNSNVPVKVLFYNGTREPLDIVWVDFDGQWKTYHRLRPDSNVTQRTFATHPWLAVDARGNCHGGVMLPNPRAQGEGANEFQIWD